MKPSKILKKMVKLLTQHAPVINREAQAVNFKGEIVDSSDPDALRFSLTGALYRVTRKYKDDNDHMVKYLLRRVLRKRYGVEDWSFRFIEDIREWECDEGRRDHEIAEVAIAAMNLAEVVEGAITQHFNLLDRPEANWPVGLTEGL